MFSLSEKFRGSIQYRPQLGKSNQCLGRFDPSHTDRICGLFGLTLKNNEGRMASHLPLAHSSICKTGWL